MGESRWLAVKKTDLAWCMCKEGGMPWNCFIDVCITAEGCVLKPAVETLRASITAVWFVELGMSRSGVFNSWYRWSCWEGTER
jgi:xylose isomerase